MAKDEFTDDIDGDDDFDLDFDDLDMDDGADPFGDLDADIGGSREPTSGDKKDKIIEALDKSLN